jgi:hypothetical protein
MCFKLRSFKKNDQILPFYSDFRAFFSPIVKTLTRVIDFLFESSLSPAKIAKRLESDSDESLTRPNTTSVSLSVRPSCKCEFGDVLCLGTAANDYDAFKLAFK